MGIFSRLVTRSRDKPKNQVSGTATRFYFGSTSSGKVVNERTAMTYSAVYAAVRVLAESIAGLPLHTYKSTENGGKEFAQEHPLYYLLHDEPNPEMTSFTFRETLMTHILLWGNAYAQIIRDGRGQVLGLYPLLPERMNVDRDMDGQLYYEYQTTQESKYKGQRVILLPHEVLHIPGLGFDGLVGYSPIAMAKNAIGAGIAAEEFSSTFFKNGAAPSGVLEHPGTLKDPSRVRDTWQSQFGGSSNVGKVAVLEEGMKYAPISISPEASQLLQTREFQIEEIARIYRIPLHLLGDLNHSTFSNIEHQSLEFCKYTLEPWVVRWEQSLRKALFTDEEKKKYFIRFNMEGLMRGDYATRVSAYATARQNGWLSVNDIRRLEDLNPIPADQGGDTYSCNGSFIPLTQAGKSQGGSNEKDQKVLGLEKRGRRR